MSIVYGILMVISFLLLIGYCFLLKQKEPWLLFLYICVTVINLGYFMLSRAQDVKFALFANKVAYFGSVFLVVCMLMTIVKLCGFVYKKYLPITLIAVALAMYAVICTTGYLPWYYKSVSLEKIDGAVKLVKEYGPLHLSYIVYIFLYFSAMVATILVAMKMKKAGSQKHAIVIAAVVFGNIAVWFVEQFIPWNFEFLAVSYLMSELIFLALYWMMQDYVHIQHAPAPIVEVKASVIDIATISMDEKIKIVLAHLPQGEILVAREREILEKILENKKRKDIADELHLSENTIKTYTRTLYNKLNVSSREELYKLLLHNEE
jgi:DNA-binding CsgD family transcriptional regulator